MDGIHDLGGMQGFGPVPRGPEAEVSFSAAWQRRVFGIALTSGLSNVDAHRHAIERLEPVTYLTAGYWGRWLGALELLLSEDDPSVRPSGSIFAERTLERAPRFGPGEAVRVRDLHTDGHTRLPAYARGRRGQVVGLRGAWVFPDSNAHGRGEDPQHVYGVRFEGRELWGETAEPGTAVILDLFEPYLQGIGA